MSVIELHGARVHVYPETPEEIEAAYAAVTTATAGTYTAVDIEHSGYDLEDDLFAVRAIQIGTDTDLVVLDPADPAQKDLARRLVDEADRLVAHQADADFVPLARIGVIDDLRRTYEKVYDTYMAAMLVRPPRDKGRFYGLKELAADLLGIASASAGCREDLMAACRENDWGSLSPRDYGPSAWSQADTRHPAYVAYAAADVVDCARVAALLLPLAELAVDPVVWDRERRLATEAAMLRLRGIRLDRDFTRARLVEQEEIATQARAEIDEIVTELGVDMTGFNKTYAPKTLAYVAVTGEGMSPQRTASGEIATGRDVLTKWHEAGSRLAAPWQRLKDAEKLSSTYYGRYLRSGADRIHPTLIPLKAATGRMASENPNFQNLPARAAGVEVRECFIADEGYVIISADFSSVEMRVAAAVTGDEALTRMYTTDPASVEDPRSLDPYWELAWTLYGPDATKADRQDVKVIVLGRMYGGGKDALADQTGLALNTVTEVLDTYDETYAGLAPWAEEQIRPLCEAGRPWWDLPSGRTQCIDPGSHWKALNSYIQGYSRDILADAMLRVADDPDLGPGLLMPIHDELLVQVPADRAEELVARLVERMGTTVAGIPIPAEGTIHGARWSNK